jgi:hypothetical protein
MDDFKPIYIAFPVTLPRFCIVENVICSQNNRIARTLSLSRLFAPHCCSD